MSLIEKSIVVNAPVPTVYDQWTRFEEFPRFMEGVESVRRLDKGRLHWTAKIGGKTVEWTAVIREEVRDRTLAWASTSGAKNHGRVLFAPIEGGSTRVTLEAVIEPEGMVESIGEALGIVAHRVEGDLARFKAYIEDLGVGSTTRQERHDGAHLAPPADIVPML